MGRIVNSTYVSLDGLTEHMEHWHYDFLQDEQMTDQAWELLERSDALIMGRVTYEGFAATWPADRTRFGDRINAIPKYVASTTLQELDWDGARLIEGDLVEGVRKARAEVDGDILQYGFGAVSEAMLQNGLLDELHLWVHPVLAGVGGQGDMLFRPGNRARLELTGTRALDCGIVVLSYRPA